MNFEAFYIHFRAELEERVSHVKKEINEILEENKQHKCYKININTHTISQMEQKLEGNKAVTA